MSKYVPIGSDVTDFMLVLYVDGKERAHCPFINNEQLKRLKKHRYTYKKFPKEVYWEKFNNGEFEVGGIKTGKQN